MSGFGNDDDDDNGADKPGGCSVGRDPGDAGAAGPAAETGRPRGPGDCGHHIMLACAARREVRGCNAVFSPPGAMYTYNGDHGVSGTRVRRRRDDGISGEACDR